MPVSVCFGASFGTGDYIEGNETTVESGYFPIVLPPAAITDLDPAFGKCQPFKSNSTATTLSHYGIWDAPIVLTPITITLPTETQNINHVPFTTPVHG